MRGLGPSDRLDDWALDEAVSVLEAWSVDAARKRLLRTLGFADFVQAFSFMTEVAFLAEASNHHPEWSNVWNRIEIALTTHTADGITKADLNLAAEIDRIASRFDLACLTGENGSCPICH